MTKTYIAALVLLLATALPGSAINPYRRYDARSGLSDNSVKDICQDSRGYMSVSYTHLDVYKRQTTVFRPSTVSKRPANGFSSWRV